jgi:lipoate-protein ligase A
MAIDRALFENFSQPVLRLYTWEKSFTFGISGDISALKDKKELTPYQESYAKRMTGGGILFHGNDLSYALIIPASFMGKRTVKESYEKICTFLLHFYKALGLEALYAKDASVEISKSEFCQLGFEDYDILIQGKKMGGNAQRRNRDIIFQHGSIGLFDLDESSHTGNSLKDLGLELPYEEAMEKLIHSFEKTFEVVLEDSILNSEENARVQELLKKEV